MNDFVVPVSTRLPLSGGHYIDVKKRLNHGETEDMYARWAPYVVQGETQARLNRREVRTAKVDAYLLGWSLVNDQGQPVAMSPDMPAADRAATIRSLDPDRFDEIHEAIEAHERATAIERAAQKKILDGKPPDAPTSASRSAAAGASTGFVN